MGFDSVDSLFTRIYEGKYAERAEPDIVSSSQGVMPMPEGSRSWGEIARNNPHYGNPEGLLRAKIVDKKDLKNPYEALSDFKAVKAKGYESRFWAKVERIVVNPFFMTKFHPDGTRVFETELRGQENASELRALFTSDPNLKKGEPWKQHAFFNLPYDSAQKVWEKAAIPSTIANRVMDETELKGLGLNDAEIKAYNDLKLTFDNTYKQVKDMMDWKRFEPFLDKPWIAELKAVVKGVPQFNQDGTPILNKVGEQVYNKVDVLNVTRNMDERERVEFTRALNRLAPLTKKLEEYRSEFGKVKYYAPLVHAEGEYVARVWKGEGKRANLEESWRFNNMADAQKKIDSLKDEYQNRADYHVEAAIVKRQPESFYQSLSDVHTEKFVEGAIDKLRNKQFINEQFALKLYDSIMDVLADDLKARGFGRHMVTRLHPEPGSAVKGYQTENGQKIVWDYLSGAAGYISKIQKTHEFYESLKDIDPKKSPERFDYWASYIKDMLRNSEPIDRASGRARSIAFAYYLTAALKPGIVNLTQNPITGFAWLGRHMRELGVKGLPETEYMKAMKDAAIGNLTDVEKKWLNDAINKGETTDQFFREAMGRISNKYGPGFDKVVQFLGTFFSLAERWNRKSAFLAMFRVAQKAGLSEEESSRQGINLVHEAHYPIGKSNLPEWARQPGTIGAGFRTAYALRSFNHNFLLSMIYSVAEKGPDGKHHLDVVMRSLAYLALFGGMTAIPFLDDILDDYERIMGDPVRAKMRKALKGVGGDMLDHFGIAGIPAAIEAVGLPGVDISGSLKIGSPTKLLTGMWKGGQAPSPVADNVYGVWGGLYNKGQYAMESASNRDWWRMAENLAPVGLENVLKAIRLSGEPVTNRRGAIQFNEAGEPMKLTPGEIAGQAAGFRPSRVAELSREKRIQSNVEARYTEKRNSIANMVRLAKSTADWDRIRSRVESYNKDIVQFQGAVPPITSESLKRAVRQIPEKQWLKWERMLGQ
jgi:hypothetical protein